MRGSLDCLQKIGDCEIQIFDDGCQDLIDRVAEVAEGWSLKDWGGDIGPMGSQHGFFGREFNDLKDATVKAGDPWSNGLQLIEKMVADLRTTDLPAPKSRKRRGTWDEDHGDEICHDRLRSGQPFWRRSVRQQVNGPTAVTIIAQTNARGTTRPDDCLWRGAVAVALASILEDAGYRVEFWTMTLSERVYFSGQGCLQAVKVKACENMLDISTLVNSVSAWFYRTVGFAGRAASTQGLNCKSSMGGPVDIAGYPQALDLLSTDENRIVISGVWSYDAAVKFAREELNKFIQKTSNQGAAA